VALATLLTLPWGTPLFPDWVFEHAQDHLLIRDAIQRQRNINLAVYPLDPMAPHDLARWLELHQTAHNDMNAVLGLASNDLTSVDFQQELQRRVWSDNNYQEHLSAHTELGV
jgi:hypothetical protein